MPNFSSLARLEVPEKFVWWVGGGVCKVIFMVNPTVVLRLGLGWGFDNYFLIDQVDVFCPIDSFFVKLSLLYFSLSHKPH